MYETDLDKYSNRYECRTTTDIQFTLIYIIITDYYL